MDRQALPSQGCCFGELWGERMIARRRLAGANVQDVVGLAAALERKAWQPPQGAARLVDWIPDLRGRDLVTLD